MSPLRPQPEAYAMRRFTRAIDRFLAGATKPEKDRAIWWLTGWNRLLKSVTQPQPPNS